MQSQEGNVGNWGEGAPNPSPEHDEHENNKITLFADDSPQHQQQLQQLQQRQATTKDKSQLKKPSRTTTTRSKKGPQTDDFDLMLLHEDFPKLLALSAQVKELRNILVNPPASRRTRPSDVSADEIQAVVDRMQQRLLRTPKQRQQSICRGKYPMTDFTIDDSIKTLQMELNHLQQWMDNHNHKKQVASSGVSQDSSPKKRGGKGSTKSTKGKEAIALKYAKWQTDILMNWMIEHLEQPFPDQTEVQKLMDQTGLSQSQVINWTTNVRKRNRKATCEGGKKPHHFIDFLFLVQDRENRKKKEREEGAKTMGSQPSEVSFDGYTSEGHQLEAVPSYHRSDAAASQAADSIHVGPDYWTPGDPCRQAETSNVLSHPHAQGGQPVGQYHNSNPYTHGSSAFFQFQEEDSASFYDTPPALPTVISDHSPFRASNGHLSIRPNEAPSNTSLEQPISLDAQELPNEELLNDFADLWLSTEGVPPVLPSVTEDSYENRSAATADERVEPHLISTDRRKRNRAPSVDLRELSNEDIHSWAAEMGLTMPTME